MKILVLFLVLGWSSTSFAEGGSTVTCDMRALGTPGPTDAPPTTVIASASGDLDAAGGIVLKAKSKSSLTEFAVVLNQRSINMMVFAGKKLIAGSYIVAPVSITSDIFASNTVVNTPDGDLVLNCFGGM